MWIILFIISIVYIFYQLCYTENFSISNFNEKVAIVSMMKNPKNLKYWLDYHKKIGIDYFYIRLEDSDDLLPILNNYENLNIEIGTSNDTPSREYNSDDPGEFQMRRQRDLMSQTLEKAVNDGIGWIIHIDSDELIDCDGKIQDNIKKEIQDHMHVFAIRNFEARYKDIPNETDNCFAYKELIDCSKGGCTSYANGKGMARVSPLIKEAGVHRYWHPHSDQNILDTIRILHFESCDFNQYVNKFLDLAKKDKPRFPFKFYNDTLEITKDCKNKEECMPLLEKLYRKYKVIEGFFNL